MNATSRASAPNSPDISIITEAPPGATPHTAVVPGSTFSRAIIQPSAALVAMMAATTARNSGQFLKKVTMMSPVIERATRQADHGLRDAHRQARHADPAAIGREQDAGQHRPEQQRRRQCHELQQRGQHRRAREQDRPLRGGR